MRLNGESGPGGGPAWVSAAVEVPAVAPERLLDAAGLGPAAAFIAPQGQAWVGLGAARWLPPGAGAVAALWAGLQDRSPGAPAPVVLGALPFSAQEQPDALWQGLAPGGLMLPEQLYILEGDRAWWRLTLPAAEADRLAPRLAQAGALLQALAARDAPALPTWQPLPEGDAPDRYAAAVDRAVQHIRRGELAKVVLARRAGVRFAHAPTAAALLERLGTHHSGCVRYAWRSAGKTWMGASPETLVQVSGQRLSTVALAGTRPLAQAEELLGSVKDRHEHAIVVDAIRRALAPYVRALPPVGEPALRRLRNLAHLQTPIEAELQPGVDFLPLVRALHPTPAVCGLPTAPAAALLATLEAEPRGLYAGPFLRLAPDGDGHAVVALRGLVLSGCEAVLPAGAGIVEGSVGEAELAETRVKQRSVLEALGRPAPVHAPAPASNAGRAGPSWAHAPVLP